MTLPSSTTRAFALALIAASALGFAGLPAFAQGTPEQREACAPDAIRLCQDTIPDVGRTTVCMRAHRAELSPACKVAFDAGAPAPAPRPRVARAKPMPRPEARPAADARGRGPADAPASARRPRSCPCILSHHHALAARGDRDTREARRVIGRLCGSKVIDADTCGFMGRMITLSE